MIEKVFIGCGAGFSGDRFDASIPIVKEFKNINAPMGNTCHYSCDVWMIRKL